MQAEDPAQNKKVTPASLVPLPACWLPAEELILYPNSSFYDYTGLSGRFKFEELANHIHPHDETPLLELLNNPQPATQSLYLRLRNQKKEYRWHCLSWVPYSAEETAKGYLCLLQDVHELYQQDEHLEEKVQQIFDELQEKESLLAQANKEMTISNARLRNILDSTKDAICSRDMDTRLLAFNKAYEEEFLKIYGTMPQVGKRIDETFAHLPAERDHTATIWKRALQGEEYTIFQEFGDQRLQRKYYEVTLSPIVEASGEQIGATAIMHDVTRERSIEKELKDAREFLILAENMPHIIFTTDSAGKPDYLNQAFYEYTGLQFHDTESSFGTLILHPDELETIINNWINSVNNLEGLQQEVRLRHHSGEFRWNLLRFLPLINGEHQAYKWIGSVTDIHEAKVSEELQRRAAQEFRQLADSLPQIIWTANPDGHTNYMNNKWYEYMGLDPERYDTNDWSPIVHPDDRELALQKWAYAVAHKEEYLIEYRFRHRQGQYRWFLGRGLPLYNEQGEVIKWFGSATDIHDQKLQNKRLWQQNQQLNQINQYLDNFVHTAAHDLRAPIANIKGLLSLLEDATPDKKEQITHNLQRSAERLDTTLQGMIQLIEVQNHTGDISRDINVGDVFFETLTDFETELSAIEHELETDFTDCPNICFVLPYLKSSFRNLISNSIKYRKTDEKLYLRVQCRQEEGFLLFIFRDNGIGIDMKRVGKNLFKPFRRFTNQAQGKGIGMHIVKNMLVKTGGKIEVESSPGEGTTFYLYLKNQHDIREQEEPEYPPIMS
jgi:PAS domain S-box-containing protein